eukprot:GHVN01073712.1.p1 GENE.GHVN01073712.1~~GHVN01073712.1.p1  ORF type:complete len:409 (-),score=60.82 GHVN01073712.1:1115-2341(-)
MWRSFSSFLTRGYEGVLVKVLYDDVYGVNEADMQETMQGLVGCRRDVTPAQATDMVVSRLRSNWTWTVALKALSLLHYIALSPQATPEWNAQLFGQTDVFQQLQEFREGEDGDTTAFSHAYVVRRYAEFLDRYLRDLTRPGAIVAVTALRSVPHRLKQMDTTDLLTEIRCVHSLLCTCVASFFNDTQVEVHLPSGFCELTAGVLTRIFRDALRLYGIVNLSVVELTERAPVLEGAEEEETVACLDLLSCTTRKLNALSIIIRTMPGISPDIIPVLTPPTCEASTVLRRKVGERRRSRSQSTGEDPDEDEMSVHESRNRNPIERPNHWEGTTSLSGGSESLSDNVEDDGDDYEGDSQVVQANPNREANETPRSRVTANEQSMKGGASEGARTPQSLSFTRELRVTVNGM